MRSIKGKETELVEELEHFFSLDLRGVTETEKKYRGMTKIHNGYGLFWPGVDERVRVRGGVGFVVLQMRLSDVTGEKFISKRLLRMEIKLMGYENWTLIEANRVNDDSTKEEKDNFF